MLKWQQKDLGERATVPLSTLRRLEGGDGVLTGSFDTIDRLRRTLEAAGVQFIAQNGGGPGVRLRSPAPEDQ